MNNYSFYLEKIGEFGIVELVNHPIVSISGLPGAKLNEVVIFDNGQSGQIFSINKESIQIIVFTKEPIEVGTKVTRTGKPFTAAVGEELFGFIIDPLGNPLFNKENFKRPSEEREIDHTPGGISERVRITKPFPTGVSIVDTMVPLGMGQKELVIGDRKTGKTAFLLAAIKNQVSLGSVIIYSAIGRKESDIKKLQSFFEIEGIIKSIIIVASASSDSPSLIYTNPYVAMTIAEFFRDKGKNVLVILDDLSTHAKFYREISLIAKRFPGRDSYPGDIFYSHAKLIERSGNFKNKISGESSITCLPVAETVEGDFTGYIATNLMGMTDGHIFFDSNVFYRGRRPAVNISLSVTRVGRQAQNQVKRDLNRELTAFLTLYEKMQNLSHFGAELTETVKYILKTGDRIYKFFEQPYNLIIPSAVQLVFVSLLWLKFFQDDPDENIEIYRNNLIHAYSTDANIKKMLDEIINANSFNLVLGNISQKSNEIINLCKTKKP